MTATTVDGRLGPRPRTPVYDSDENPTWMADAACTRYDPDMWHPLTARDETTARAICWNDCPVRTDCLRYAFEHGQQHGVWGGHNFDDRSAMRRLRRQQEAC